MGRGLDQDDELHGQRTGQRRNLEAMAIKEDDTGTLATIDVPALILSGSHDIFIPKDSPNNLNEGIRNSTHHVIQDAGHVASLENPTAVNQHIEDFLKSI